MPNALAVPAAPASLRNERRWSAISRCPTRLRLRERSCKSHAQAQDQIRTIFVNDSLQRLEAEAVAGIVDLRAVGEGGDHVHLGTEARGAAMTAFMTVVALPH